MRLMLSFAALAIATAASAQDAPRPMLSDACRAEMTNLCPATGDREARRACMIASRDKLSDGCKKEMAALRAARQARRANGDMTAPGATSTDQGPAPKPQ